MSRKIVKAVRKRRLNVDPIIPGNGIANTSLNNQMFVYGRDNSPNVNNPFSEVYVPKNLLPPKPNNVIPIQRRYSTNSIGAYPELNSHGESSSNSDDDYTTYKAVQHFPFQRNPKTIIAEQKTSMFVEDLPCEIPSNGDPNYLDMAEAINYLDSVIDHEYRTWESDEMNFDNGLTSEANPNSNDAASEECMTEYDMYLRQFTRDRENSKRVSEYQEYPSNIPKDHERCRPATEAQEYLWSFIKNKEHVTENDEHPRHISGDQEYSSPLPEEDYPWDDIDYQPYPEHVMEVREHPNNTTKEEDYSNGKK